MKAFKSPAIHRTPLYRAKSAYHGMDARCLNKNGKNPSYASVELRMTEEQWLNWAIPEYEKFLKEYPDDSPCVSRYDDSGHYEIGNIRVISTAQNRAEMKVEMQVKADGTKRCSSCRKIKIAADEFSNNRTRRDGYATSCKECHKFFRASQV